jgi:hypothetical protein
MSVSLSDVLMNVSLSGSSLSDVYLLVVVGVVNDVVNGVVSDGVFGYLIDVDLTYLFFINLKK